MYLLKRTLHRCSFVNCLLSLALPWRLYLSHTPLVVKVLRMFLTVNPKSFMTNFLSFLVWKLKWSILYELFIYRKSWFLKTKNFVFFFWNKHWTNFDQKSFLNKAIIAWEDQRITKFWTTLKYVMIHHSHLLDLQQTNLVKLLMHCLMFGDQNICTLNFLPFI